MILTGVAQESDFTEGTSQFFLVFNQGRLRLPVSEEAASTAIDYFSSEQKNTAVDPEQLAGEQVAYEEGAEIFSSEEPPQQDLYDYSKPPEDHDVTESEDPDDGVDQV